MSIVEQIEQRMQKYMQPDPDGNVTVEYGDFPVYGDGRTNHKFVTNRAVVNLRQLHERMLWGDRTPYVVMDIPQQCPWENPDLPFNAVAQGAD